MAWLISETTSHMRTYIFFFTSFSYIIQEEFHIPFLLIFLAELSASVARVGQGSRRWLNGKDMQVAEPKNGNIV
jgi:hypothetical protein